MALVDLEKAFDTAPREVVWLALKKVRVEELMAYKRDTIHVRWSDNSSENEGRRKQEI